MRLMAKVNRSKAFAPFGGGNNNHPAGTGTDDETTGSEGIQFTQVLSNRALNEIKAGHADYRHGNQNLTKWTKHWQAPRVTTGSPRITFQGFSVPGNNNYPRYRGQDTYSLRDDFTFSYNAGGRHDRRVESGFLPRQQRGAGMSVPRRARAGAAAGVRARHPVVADLDRPAAAAAE